MSIKYTKTAAHRLFGDLYRRSRPSDLQKKIEQIVKEHKDVLTRIRLIEELDQQYANNEVFLKKRPKNKKNRAKAGISRDPHAVLGEASISPVPKSERRQSMAEKNSFQAKGGAGFFVRLLKSLGTENKRIIDWGRKTNTLRSGLLGLKLSKEAQGIFLGPKQETIINALKALRLAIGSIWEHTTALEYNTLIASYQFFYEYVKHENIFSRSGDARKWIDSTLLMQKSYAHFLKYTKHKTLLLRSVPNYIASSKKYAYLVPDLKKSMQHIISLGERKPDLKNTIIVFYVLAENKLYRWEEIEKKLFVKEAVHNRFCSPKKVQVLIQEKIERLKKKNEEIQDEIQKIDMIRTKYLAIKEDGHFDNSFLDQLIYDIVRRAYGERKASAHVAAFYKSQPHRLLFVVLRDFNINYMPLIGPSLIISGKDKVSETINIFSPNLFLERIESFHQLLRSVDAYLRKYPGLNYSFSDFRKDLERKIFDPSLDLFHNIVQKANQFFKTMVLDIQSLLSNHQKAKAMTGLEEKEQAQQRVKPIENLEIKPRYLPYAEFQILSSGRFNEKRVEEAFENLLAHMYNYLYIFLDSSMTKLLYNSKGIKIKQKKIQEKLQRLEREEIQESITNS